MCILILRLIEQCHVIKGVGLVLLINIAIMGEELVR